MINVREIGQKVEITIKHDYADYPETVDFIWNINRARDGKAWTHPAPITYGGVHTDSLLPDWFRRYGWKYGDRLDVTLMLHDRPPGSNPEIDTSNAIYYLPFAFGFEHILMKILPPPPVLG